MSELLFAIAPVATWSLVEWLVFIIVIAGAVGIAYVILKQTGVQIPAYIATVLWIILAVVVGVVAIRFLASLL